MVKIILCGCGGHMGRVVTDIAAADQDTEIVAGIDLAGGQGQDYPVFTDIAACDVTADALIDFSSPKALDGILDYCLKIIVPAMMLTTG